MYNALTRYVMEATVGGQQQEIGSIGPLEQQMAQEKVGASRHNARTTSGNNPSSGSKTPQTPHHGGGGSPDSESSNGLELNHHQSINHNHCPLDDCDPFTEHRYPAAIADHIEYHFLFEESSEALTRYGPDVVNKGIAVMRAKIVHEKFIPGNLGGYLRSRCEKILKGTNVATGEDRQRRIDAITNYVDPVPAEKEALRGPPCGCPDFAHRIPCKWFKTK